MTSSERDGRGSEAAERLHWTSIFFGLGPIARGALALLVVLAAAGDVGWELWAFLALIPSGIGAVARYITLRYQLDAQALVITEGLLERRSRVIPYVRIQHVEVTQGPLQRLLGVAVVNVQSAGGADEPEAALRVLPVGRAEALRQRIDRARGRPDAPPDVVVPADAVLLRLRLRDLVICGLTQGRGWLVVGAGLAIAWQAMELFNVELPVELDDGTFEQTVRAALAGLPSPATAALIIAAVAVLFRLLSVGWAIVKLHGFTLARDGDLLRSRYGLLTSFSATIPRGRVQMLTILEPWLMRLAGRASVRVETASKFDTDSQRVAADWLAPTMARTGVARLVDEVVPGVDPDRVEWTPVSPAAWERLLRPYAALNAAGLAGVVAMFGWTALALAPIVAAGVWAGARGVARGYGYALAGGAIAFRSGWLSRRTSLVRTARVQTVVLRESFLDRRWGMATLDVDTAGSGEEAHRVVVPYLARADAERLFAALRVAADDAGIEPAPAPAPGAR